MTKSADRLPLQKKLEEDPSTIFDYQQQARNDRQFYQI